MRYHLESTLPIHAFQPLVKHSPFKQGMTLEGGGGGGGGFISAITDPISSVLGTDGGGGGILGALADVDKAVGDTVPGGWGTIAAVAVPYAAPMITGAALTAGQAAALAAGTRAATGAIRGEDAETILKGSALAGAGAFAGSELFGPEAGVNWDADITAGAEGYANTATESGVSGATNSIVDAIPQPSPTYTPDETIDFGMTDTNLPETEGIKSLVAEPKDVYSAQGGRSDPFIGATPTSNIYTDLPVGYEFMGPDGMEIVAPNGKTYLQKDLYESLANLSDSSLSMDGLPSPSLNPESLLQNVRADAKPYIPDYDPQISAFQPVDSNQALQNQYEAQDVMQQGRSVDIPQGTSGSVYNPARPDFLQDPLQNISNRASDAYDYLKEKSLKEMGSDLYDFAGRNKLELGLGALALSSMGGQQPQPSPAGYSSGYSPYTGGYGSSGGVAGPYLLRNRINASNIYNYRNPYTSRYAQGGEVKHFAFGGISNALTRFTQPIEKAIVQPVGQALPFLKDVAPYAGILAAPFITNPAMAVGVGALSSGFGRPGTGFDMKRALMGGIAAYGASTVGAGLEAAGQENYAMPDGGTGFTSGSMDDAIGAVKESPKSFFRDTDAMQKGVGNLLSSDSDAATKAFGTKASIFKSGVPIVMGTSGMMAIDEANKMREEAERSAGAGRQEQADMLARISKGRKRAEQAVRENPYMYAMGGSVDDELGGDYSAMGMDQGNMQKGLFGLGYAAGGTPRFLSGGGDGMSDSIPATIGGTQEARLADGEFVIPADVVSHLGNGSSKAGAKQLYSMMDRVRKARTGNKKQGRQIKPNKLMPA